MIKCSHCGKDVSEFIAVCPNCGNKIIPNDKALSAKVSKPSIKMSIRNKIIIACAAIVMTISAFFFVCAQNAYNAVIGKSVLGVGRIFFEEAVIRGTIKSIAVAKGLSALVMVVCVVIIAVCIIRFLRRE